MPKQDVSRQDLVRAAFCPDGKNVATQAAKGMGFTLGGVVIRFLISTGSTAVLARLLTPADFGEVAMSMIVTEFANLFANFGLQSILIQKRKLSRIQLDTIFWAGMALSIILMFTVLVLSFFAGDFFHDDVVGRILRVSAWSFFLEELRAVHSAIMFRLMLFKLDFYIQVVGLVLRSVFAVGLAMAGVGVLSMVLGPLLGSMIVVIASWVLVPYRPRLRFSRPFFRSSFKIGTSYLGTGFLFYCMMNFDIIVIARLLGAVQLGYYQTSRALTDELRARITTPLQRVLFPAYSQMQADLNRFQQAVVRSTKLIALIIAPIGVGIAATSHETVLLLFGDRWVAMVPILVIVALAATFRATLAVGTPIFNALGRVDTSLRLNTVNTVIFFVAISLGSHWGVLGVALGSLASALAFSLVGVGAFKLLELSALDLFYALAPPYFGAFVMFCMVSLARDLFWQQDSSFLIVQMLSLIIVGAVTYIGTIAVICRPLLKDALDIIRRLGAR